MKYLIVLLTLFSTSVFAAHLITDPLPTTGTVGTHCGWFFDSAAEVLTPNTPAAQVPAPNTPPAGSLVCYYDVGSMTPGAHTAKVRNVWVDPTGVWPNAESIDSNTASFTVPATPAAAATVRVIK